MPSAGARNDAWDAATGVDRQIDAGGPSFAHTDGGGDLWQSGSRVIDRIGQGRLLSVAMRSRPGLRKAFDTRARPSVARVGMSCARSSSRIDSSCDARAAGTPRLAGRLGHARLARVGPASMAGFAGRREPPERRIHASRSRRSDDVVNAAWRSRPCLLLLHGAHRGRSPHSPVEPARPPRVRTRSIPRSSGVGTGCAAGVGKATPCCTSSDIPRLRQPLGRRILRGDGAN
jgi:hypothetical protein